MNPISVVAAMANPWFRMYSEFASDSKVQMMGEAMQRRLVMLFCMRCSDVTVTLSDEEIAFQMRISADELADTKALFMKKGFVDNDWNLINWDKRQSPSDSSAARTRAYRERMKEVTVTSRVTECDALDKNREEEKREEKDPPIPPKGGEGKVDHQKTGRSPKIGFEQFRTACRELGEKPVPEGDAVFAYADSIGLPHGFIGLAWRWFKSRYSDKKQAGVRGWRQTFRNAVEGNWPKLWFQAEDGSWQLTTAGKQAKLAAESESHSVDEATR